MYEGRKCFEDQFPDDIKASGWIFFPAQDLGEEKVDEQVVIKGNQRLVKALGDVLWRARDIASSTYDLIVLKNDCPQKGSHSVGAGGPREFRTVPPPGEARVPDALAKKPLPPSIIGRS